MDTEPPEPVQDERGRWLTSLGSRTGVAFTGVTDPTDLREGDILCLPGDDARIESGPGGRHLVSRRRPTIWRGHMALSPRQVEQFGHMISVIR